MADAPVIPSTEPTPHAVTWPPPIAYEWCDRASGPLILVLIVFCPWAFGSTADWEMHTANTIAYLLGLLLIAKWIIRRITGYYPPRWGNGRARRSVARGATRPTLLTTIVGCVTVALLLEVLISALNARATYSYARGTFDYHRCLSWLPHSYDDASTWDAFWNYLAWAAAFWALRDWLLGKSEAEVLEDLGTNHVIRSEIGDRRSEIGGGGVGGRWSVVSDRICNLKSRI